MNNFLSAAGVAGNLMVSPVAPAQDPSEYYTEPQVYGMRHPPFPRPPIRPNGCPRGRPAEANS